MDGVSSAQVESSGITWADCEPKWERGGDSRMQSNQTLPAQLEVLLADDLTKLVLKECNLNMFLLVLPLRVAKGPLWRRVW